MNWMGGQSRSASKYSRRALQEYCPWLLHQFGDLWNSNWNWLLSEANFNFATTDQTYCLFHPASTSETFADSLDEF
jgi:hypothetical protein